MSSLKSLSQLSRELNKPISRLTDAARRLKLGVKIGPYRNATVAISEEDEAKFRSYFGQPATATATRLQATAAVKLGNPKANDVAGLSINRCVIFRAGDQSPSGVRIERALINRLQVRFAQESPIKIYSLPDAERVTDIVGVADNFKIADSQLVADIELLSKHPLSQKVADLIKRDPAAVGFALTDDGDGLVILVRTGTALAARAKDTLRLAQSDPASYNAQRAAESRALRN